MEYLTGWCLVCSTQIENGIYCSIKCQVKDFLLSPTVSLIEENSDASHFHLDDEAIENEYVQYFDDEQQVWIMSRRELVPKDKLPPETIPGDAMPQAQQNALSSSSSSSKKKKLKKQHRHLSRQRHSSSSLPCPCTCHKLTTLTISTTAPLNFGPDFYLALTATSETKPTPSPSSSNSSASSYPPSISSATTTSSSSSSSSSSHSTNTASFYSTSLPVKIPDSTTIPTTAATLIPNSKNPHKQERKALKSAPPLTGKSHPHHASSPICPQCHHHTLDSPVSKHNSNSIGKNVAVVSRSAPSSKGGASAWNSPSSIESFNALLQMKRRRSMSVKP